MRRTLLIALREFLATVKTKGFIIGVLITPAIILAAVMLIPRLMNKEGPRVYGRVAVIDQSGLVTEGVESRLKPEVLEQEREKVVGAVKEKIDESLDKTGVVGNERAMASSMSKGAVEQAIPQPPAITVERLGPDTDIEKAKEQVRDADVRAKDAKEKNPRLALVVIPDSAVRAVEGAEGAGPKGYTGYDFFVAPKLDPQVKDNIQDKVNDAITDARIEASGLGDRREFIRAMVSRPSAKTVTVTAAGEREGSDAAAFLIPMGFMMLLWISVFTAGQGLLTSTIEEKGSRVMEVLLSAVSPVQVMVGKILGQMGVGLLIMGVYAVMGVGALQALKMIHMLDASATWWALAYFMIAFFLVAALMAAIGSAVTEMREAQALMTPVMIVLMLPWILWMPIQRNPNSMFATVISFIPPISPFAMVLRLSGAEPVPAWQVPATIVVGIISVVLAIWMAAKIFRVGVLMYGKPPNFATLLRWIRMS